MNLILVFKERYNEVFIRHEIEPMLKALDLYPLRKR